MVFHKDKVHVSINTTQSTIFVLCLTLAPSNDRNTYVV